MNTSIGNIVGIALIAGILGTACMTMFLQIITKMGVANADMVRAIGSLFTKTLKSAFSFGIILHIISGIIFAFLYTYVIIIFNIHGVLSVTGSGILIGFIHGGIVGFVLVTAVAENHPLPKFQKAGFSVAIAHWTAHIVYGFIVGLTIGVIGY